MTNLAIAIYLFIGLYISATAVFDNSRPNGALIVLGVFVSLAWPLFLLGSLVGRGLRERGE